MTMRLLVANRGEIALRVLRAAHELRAETVAVFTGPDTGAAHVVAAHRSVAVPSYLDVEALVAAARASGATAVHPGYGFLSERADFAAAVVEAGLCWVGPPPSAIAAMGDKVAARAAMVAAGVPVVPGVASADPATVVSVGFPLLVKAAAGGGGRGMRVVRAEEDLAGALSAASAEAAAAFGDGTLYAERLLVNARHVEIQVLADAHGTCVALGERECSVQRRHQKVIEEAPCPGLDAGTRAAMGDAAVRAACAVGYRGAGTVEFLLGEDGAFYFLEMNTRIQVEHPITELTWGVDLVREQLRIAQGMRIDPANGSARGHAIEARLYAEDPARGYLPSPGPLLRFRMPSGPGIRVDTGYREGDSVPPDYDAMLAKVIAWAPTREHALARLDLALAETEVAGVVTNVEFLRDVLAAPEFAAGAVHTAWLSERFSSWAPPSVDDLLVVAARALADPSAREISRAPGSTAPTPWQVVGPLGRAR